GRGIAGRTALIRGPAGFRYSGGSGADVPHLKVALHIHLKSGSAAVRPTARRSTSAETSPEPPCGRKGDRASPEARSSPRLVGEGSGARRGRTPRRRKRRPTCSPAPGEIVKHRGRANGDLQHDGAEQDAGAD